jgi:NRPS condensation-like uncharacterized protein
MPVASAPGRPFTPADQVGCYFDSAAEPNNVHLELWLPGQLRADALRAAVATALTDLPEAGQRRAAGPWWQARYAWDGPAGLDADPVAESRWRTMAELDALRARFLSAAPALGQSPPFRLLLARGPQWDSLILNAHHAAFDGRSCVLLLGLIAQRYPAGEPAPAAGGPAWGAGRAEAAGWTAGPPPAAGPVPRPADRVTRPFLDNSKKRGGRPFSRRAFPARTVARIAARPGSRPGRRAAPGYGLSLLDWPAVPVLAPRQKESRPTVNDLLLVALADTVGRWNGPRRGRSRPVRISMPLDTRRPGADRQLGNLSRLATVTVDPERDQDPLAAVTAQTRRAKSGSGPLVSPALAALIGMPLPAGAKRTLVRLVLGLVGVVACDTTLLSNLGVVSDPPAFGALVPTRMWFSTSTHMPRGLSVGAVTVGGRLQLCFRYRRALFDDPAGRVFAAGYAAALAAREAQQAALLPASASLPALAYGADS